MTSLQAILGHLVTILLWVVLGGIIHRRRYREWMFFPIFILSVAVWSVLTALWPEYVRVPELWMFKEGLYNILRLAMAVELGVRTFRAFPGAMATLKRVLFVLLLITVMVALATAPKAFNYKTFVGEFQPRVVAAAIWLFTGIAVLILWYRLPVSRFQKHIVLSYVLFLPIFATYMNLWGNLGGQRSLAFGYVYQLSYLTLVSFWAYVCWRPDRPLDQDKAEGGVHGLE